MLEPTVEGAYGDMQKLISTRKKIPKAFFADNDIIAFSAIRALKDAGYSLPKDISVVGFDDTPYCNLRITSYNVCYTKLLRKQKSSSKKV